MDIIALVISGLAAIVAAIGTILANRRANDALKESRRAVTTALWSAVQEAVQRLVGFDPSTEPVGERLANLRIAMIALTDEYEDWEGLDAWLEAERTLGATIAREVIETALPGESADSRLKVLDLHITWAQALSQNLRRFRNAGYDKNALAKLRHNDLELIKTIHERHGWEMPPTSNPRLAPLE